MTAPIVLDRVTLTDVCGTESGVPAGFRFTESEDLARATEQFGRPLNSAVILAGQQMPMGGLPITSAFADPDADGSV